MCWRSSLFYFFISVQQTDLSAAKNIKVFHCPDRTIEFFAFHLLFWYAKPYKSLCNCRYIWKTCDANGAKEQHEGQVGTANHKNFNLEISLRYGLALRRKTWKNWESGLHFCLLVSSLQNCKSGTLSVFCRKSIWRSTFSKPVWKRRKDVWKFRRIICLCLRITLSSQAGSVLLSYKLLFPKINTLLLLKSKFKCFFNIEWWYCKSYTLNTFTYYFSINNSNNLTVFVD